MEFIGLLVVNDIDNWIGMYFEHCLDTFYEDITISENYLFFNTNKMNKIGTFLFIMVWSVSNVIWYIFDSAYNKGICENIDTQYENLQ